MRVLIIGAGIGGLALAQALHAAGIAVAVHDRDPHVAATGGYQLHLDDEACAVLRRHLPPGAYEALLASSANRSSHRRITFTDHRLRPLAQAPIPLDEEMLFVGRVPLRTVLTTGIEDAITWGSSYVGHEVLENGSVRAHFSDGSTDTADVMVGADGANSKVAEALAGRPTASPVGIGGIAGRSPLTPALRSMLPASLSTGSILGIGPGGTSIFVTPQDTTQGPAVSVGPGTDGERPSARTDQPPFVYWGVNAALDRLPHARRVGTAAALSATDTLLKGWSPLIRRLVKDAEPGSVDTFRYHASDPDAHLTPWSSGPVTALGDAVHAMPPTGGRAAATAVRDAEALASALIDASRGTTTIPVAVHEYERALHAYAGAAIRTSMTPIVWQRRLAKSPMAQLARVGTALAAPMLGLRRAATAR